MRVLLADEHSKVRWALRTVLEEEPGLSVVGEISRSDNLLTQAIALQPDLILLEWELPGRPIAALLPALHNGAARTRVVVLSRHPEVEGAALAAGADAFMSKAETPDHFLAALRRLLSE